MSCRSSPGATLGGDSDASRLGCLAAGPQNGSCHKSAAAALRAWEGKTLLRWECLEVPYRQWQRILLLLLSFAFVIHLFSSLLCRDKPMYPICQLPSPCMLGHNVHQLFLEFCSKHNLLIFFFSLCNFLHRAFLAGMFKCLQRQIKARGPSAYPICHCALVMFDRNWRPASPRCACLTRYT